MRLFIGLRPDPKSREMIAQGFQPLRRIREVSWVPEENLHLTLAFLGEADARILPDLNQVIGNTSTHCQPVQLTYGEAADVFPGWHSPRVIWLGAGAPGLAQLHQRLWQELIPLGFKGDNRFHPHITLGRVKRQLAQADLAAVQQARWPGKMETIQEITLFESVLRPEGPRYKVLSTHTLT